MTVDVDDLAWRAVGLLRAIADLPLPAPEAGCTIEQINHVHEKFRQAREPLLRAWQDLMTEAMQRATRHFIKPDKIEEYEHLLVLFSNPLLSRRGA